MEDENPGLLTPPVASVPDTPTSTQTEPPPTQASELSTSQPPESSPMSAPGPSTSTTAPPPPPQHNLSMDGIIHSIVTHSNLNDISRLVTVLNETQGRESVLVQPTSSNQDPLQVLNPTVHTLGLLYILHARLYAPPVVAPPVPFSYISYFCRQFDPTQAHLAPERVTALAKAIVQLAENQKNIKAAIAPLHDLLTRFSPDLSYLTTIHPHFLLACAGSQHYTAALPIITTPITNISLTLCPDLVYTDHLVYHFTAGVVAAALRRFELAEDLLEICVTAPAVSRGSALAQLGVGPGNMSGLSLGVNVGGASGIGGAIISGGIGGREGRGMRYPTGLAGIVGFVGESSAIQVDAVKKIILIQLILHGKASGPPRFTHPALTRVISSNTPYGAFARAYPAQASVLQTTAENAVFSQDGNSGLVKQALARAPRWMIRRLTETYLTLGLINIGRAVGIENVEEVRRMVVSMINAGEIRATISGDGTVSFADEVPMTISKAEMDTVLARVQTQERVLRALEREMARSREYLNMAVRTREDGGGSSAWLAGDEDWSQSPTTAWAEEADL